MNFVKATGLFEGWLGSQLTIVQADLDRKHLNMTTTPLTFLRATFYRWAQIWPELCPDHADAPLVDSAADAHVEQFGTWRDQEARLIWGLNDGDEAFRLPYTNDLTRLTTSAALLHADGLKISVSDACEWIMRGYMKGMNTGACPFVLAEKHGKLRRMALSDHRDPKAFWRRMQGLPAALDVPEDAVETLAMAMPQGTSYRLCTRQAGEGSLGRQRFVAVGQFKGGMIAREVKALAPSAVLWAQDSRSRKSHYDELILNSPARAKDPCTQISGRWILRRLAPDCSRIDLSGLSAMQDRTVLLKAMGREIANIHLGSPRGTASRVLADLESRRRFWLEESVEEMVDAVEQDFRRWRRQMANK